MPVLQLQLDEDDADEVSRSLIAGDGDSAELDAGDDVGGGGFAWEVEQAAPMEAEDLAAAAGGPDKVVATGRLRPRRIAVCYNVAGFQLEKLLRQHDSSLLLNSVLLVKFYEVHGQLGVFGGHDCQELGTLTLQLPPGATASDLCVSDLCQTVCLADTRGRRVHVVDLDGRLQFSFKVGRNGPQALCADDRRGLLFVCCGRKVRLCDLRTGERLRSFKDSGFRSLVSAAVFNDRLWLADAADKLHLCEVRDRGAEIHVARSVEVTNPHCVTLDASGSAFVTCGEPLHRVAVFGPRGAEVGGFGSWGDAHHCVRMPTGACVFQLSDLVDKRQLVLCCFPDCFLRAYRFKNPDTSVV